MGSHSASRMKATTHKARSLSIEIAQTPFVRSAFKREQAFNAFRRSVTPDDHSSSKSTVTTPIRKTQDPYQDELLRKQYLIDLNFPVKFHTLKLQMRKRLMLELYSYERNLESHSYYYIDAGWLKQWLSFMRNPQQEIEPGPVSNQELQADIAEAIEKDDYFMITDRLWKMFKGVYGGGPAIEAPEKRHEQPKKKPSSSQMLIGIYKEHKAENIKAVGSQLTHGVAGFENNYLFCYLNACLQMLVSVAPLRNFLLTGVYQRCSHLERVNSGMDMCRALAKVERDVWLREDIFPKTRDIQNLLRGTFSPYNENDCHEALLFILSKMQEELTPKTKAYPTMEGKDWRQVWEAWRDKNPCIIDELFGGLLRSTVTCLGCKYESVTYDPFYDLQLPIKGVKGNIYAVLDAFLQKEFLDKKSYGCENCGKFNKAHKRMELVQLPRYLMVVLKRFSGVGSKIKQRVDVPLSLDLTQQFRAKPIDSHPARFNLLAMIEHLGGSSSSGHYLAYFRRSDKWYEGNDTKVKPITAAALQAKMAYVLLYECES